MKNKCGYTKKQLQLIRNFIKDINEEIVLRISPRGDFCCELPQYKLFLGNKKLATENILWEKWYRQQDFYCGIVSNRMIALLHEIGHFETFDINEWLSRNEETERLIKQYYKNKINFKELNYKYWEIPNEYKATAWAINYYQKNKEKCDLLAQQIGYKYIDIKESE